jgi:hypothetical protein
MTNRTREILDFSMNEPDSAFDIEQMVRDCTPDELNFLEKIAGNLNRAVRRVRAKRLRQIEKLTRPE